MSNYNNKKGSALITGASGGIGLEIARLFAKDGINLVLVARNLDKLTSIKEELQKQYRIEVKVLSIDLSVESAYKEVLTYVTTEGLSIDYLVNNAGYGLQDAFMNGSADYYQLMINLNINTLTSLTRTIGEQMVQKGKGRILNIASVAGFQPYPYFSVYAATKAYVISFSAAIHKELENTGVSVTTLSPGLTATGFIERATMDGTKILKTGIMPAGSVAKTGYKAMMKGKRHVVPGISNNIMVFFTTIIPNSRFKLNLLAKMMK